MASVDIDTVDAQDLINAQARRAAVASSFGS